MRAIFGVWESVALNQLRVVLCRFFWDASQIGICVIGVIQAEALSVSCRPLKIIHKAPSSVTAEIHPIVLGGCLDITKDLCLVGMYHFWVKASFLLKMLCTVQGR